MITELTSSFGMWHTTGLILLVVLFLEILVAFFILKGVYNKLESQEEETFQGYKSFRRKLTKEEEESEFVDVHSGLRFPESQG